MTHYGGVHAQRSHIGLLRELLKIVAKFLGKDGHGDHVAILELKLSSGVSEPGDNKFSVLHVAYNHSADIVIDTKDIGNGIGHDETIGDFLLSANDHCVVTTDGDRSLPESLYRLESVLHLIDATVR
jgi:hypothetical protein